MCSGRERNDGGYERMRITYAKKPTIEDGKKDNGRHSETDAD